MQVTPINTTGKSKTQMESVAGNYEEQSRNVVATQSWLNRIWQAMKRYPIPLGALVLLLASLVFWLTGNTKLANWTLLVIVIMGGIPLLWDTVKHIIHKEFSVDFIAILAISGSLLLQEYLAGAFIVLMLSGGEALEAFALRRARTSLSALAERAPRTAHIWQDDQLVAIPAESVEVDMLIVVKPGELIPVDGIVSSGASNVSEADLTGEPLPVRKTAPMPVLSGSVNLDGVLEVRATRRSAESKYAQIVRLVEEAQTQKAPIHRLADRYAVWFTIVAIAFAGLSWAISGDSVYALAVLVVATPCPLILATPIAIMSGIDLAAKNGIIAKSGAAIEQLGEVDVAVFDKTGTLTLGIPKVTAIILPEDQNLVGTRAGLGKEWALALSEVIPESSTRSASHALPSYDQNTLLRLAASVEQLSTHILARAVVDAAIESNITLSPVTDFEEIFGKGVQGAISLVPDDPQLDGYGSYHVVNVAVGNHTFMQHLNITVPQSLLSERKHRVDEGQICSFIAVDHRIAGLIVLEDVPRPELTRLSTDLKSAGMKETVLLTGDSDVVARQIGELAQVDRTISRCLPDDKLRIIRELETQGHRVLMVGDGINDAPALATATVGMALGSQGLTAAATAADTVLLSTDILRVVKAVRIGRWSLRVALQGIWVGMGLSGIAMLFAALGFISPAAGAILQEGIDVIVILNALRVSRLQV
ncbi:MAG TPA: heavy metal translocating P-type ATPase [Ktedonobacteraceae bacterium]|nr:heavy metal translocating P-type ATPase [Ktedonobacteraceae bacterium]